VGSDGSFPNERIARHCSFGTSWGESIVVSGTKAKEIVEMIVCSDGIPSRGNRKNLFSKDFGYVGISVGPHPTQGTICVIDYSEKIGKVGELSDIKIVVQEELPKHVQAKLNQMGLKNVVLDKKGPVNGKQKSERLINFGKGAETTGDLKKAFGVKQPEVKRSTTGGVQPVSSAKPSSSKITKTVNTTVVT
jgi:hypothetical protein